jgi:hypothetical protein
MPELHDLLERRASGYRPSPDLFERVLDRRDRRQRNRRVAAGVLGIAVFALVAIGFARLLGSEGTPASDPQSPFAGTWVSTSDADGGTQTMTVTVSADDAVEIVVSDTIATVCGGTPSTMTGTGRIEGGTALVIPAPNYTCDDGSEPETLTGPPLQDQLRDWTLFLDPQTDTLSDGVGGVWLRDGAEEPEPATSGQMWPQSTLDEVRTAQELANAGDPDYMWQVDAGLAAEDYSGTWDRLYNGQVELVDRFLREVLGWDAYIQNTLVGGADASLTDQRFLRCAPGRTNPLYPPQPDSPRGWSCAPTLDDFTYESVSLDLVQPVRQGPGGIWVVSNWRPTTFEQADPTVAQAQATERLEEFLAARIAGRGAEGYVDVWADWLGQEFPLLYATTSGAPYERFEFERLSSATWPYGGPTWPYGGDIGFRIRLFAEDGTVVEQDIYSHWDGGASVGIEGGLGMASITTENGQPVPMLHAQFDGHVTYLSPSPNSYVFGDDGFIDFTDPALYWSDCAQGPAPTDAAAFARAVIEDPDFETTAPVAARVGGVEALAMDVALSPGGRVCGPYHTDVHQWINSLEPGKRLRLFLVDVPEGMSMRTLAITVMAPVARFDDAVVDATPIIDSIEFHPATDGDTGAR